MRRAAAFLMASAMPALALGAPCARVPHAPSPIWFTENAYPRVRDPFTCPAKAEGSWTIAFTVINGTTKTPLDDPKHKELPPRWRPFVDRIAHEYNRPVCHDQHPSPVAPLKLLGIPGEEQLHFAVTAEVVITGTGDLKPLSQTIRREVWCPACRQSSRGSLYPRLHPRDGRMVLEASLDPGWYRCVRDTSTLELRTFVGSSEKEVLAAIAPSAVVPISLQKLHASLKEKNGKLTGELPLPINKICAAKPSHLAWELWGEGELYRAAGGGRSRMRSPCP